MLCLGSNLKRFAVLLVLLSLPLMASSVLAQDGAGPSDKFKEGVAWLEQIGIPTEALSKLSADTIRNPQELAKVLAQYGMDQEQIQQFMTPENVTKLLFTVNPNKDQELLTQAMTIAGKYGIDQAALLALLPNATDPQALAAALAQKGLDAGQIRSLLQEVGPVIQEAVQKGSLDYVVNTMTYETLSAMGIPPYMLNAGVINLDEKDPQKLAEEIARANEKYGWGFTAEQLQQATGVIGQAQSMGLSNYSVMLAAVQVPMERLAAMGLPASAIYDIAALAGDPDAIKAYLEEMGFEGAAAELAFQQLEGYFASSMAEANVTPDMIEQFAEEQASKIAESVGLDEEQFQEALDAAGDPEALQELLDSYGLSDEQIALFTRQLNHSVLYQMVSDAEDEGDADAEDEGDVDAEDEGDADAESDAEDEDEDDTDAEGDAEDEGDTDAEDDAEGGDEGDTGGEGEGEGEGDAGGEGEGEGDTGGEG